MYQANDDERDEKSYNRNRWALLVMGLLVLVASISMFAICIWIRFDLDFWEWVEEMDWYTYWYCVYYIMITLIVVAFTSLLMVYGVLKESAGALGTCLFLLILCFIMNFIGAIIICIFGVEESHILINELNDVFLELIYKMDYDDRASRILKIVQEYVRCCGADGSDDYINAKKPVPWECRDRITGSEYGYGCRQSFAWYLEPWTATLAGGLVVFMALHVIQLVLIYKVVGKLREYQKTGYYDDED